MVKLKSLKNDPNNRTIRAIVDSPFGQIKVFEPTVEDVEEIINLQDFISALNGEMGEVDENAEGILDISATTVVKDLFPRLTDIEVDYMSDEEIQDIITHPNLALSQVKLIISGIISDIYKMMILSIGNRLKDEDLSENAAQVTDKVMNVTMEKLSKSEKGKEILDVMGNVNEVTEAIKSDDTKLKEEVAEKSYMKLVTGSQKSTGIQDKILEDHVGNKFDDLKD